jgi:hypothetical protein
VLFSDSICREVVFRRPHSDRTATATASANSGNANDSFDRDRTTLHRTAAAGLGPPQPPRGTARRERACRFVPRTPSRSHCARLRRLLIVRDAVAHQEATAARATAQRELRWSKLRRLPDERVGELGRAVSLFPEPHRGGGPARGLRPAGCRRTRASRAAHPRRRCSLAGAYPSPDCSNPPSTCRTGR